MWHEIVRLGLVRIFYPCLMIFGTIGNILCLKILLRKRFRRQSTCQYLCILAVIDILFIYMRSARYLYRQIYDDDLRNTSLWICRTFIFFSSSLSHLASWILVIVSFDRYFIVKNVFLPRHVGWRVIKSTCMLIFIVCIINIHYFYILGINMRLHTPIEEETDEVISNQTFYYVNHFVCIPHPSFKEFFHVYLPIYDLLFVAIIPFFLMIFTNIGIIRTTMRSNTLCRTSRKQQRNNRLTIMLLSVILAFMLLTCPSVIYICLNRLTSSTRRFSNTKLLILDLLESLWYTKHALNFILYTLSGQDFRREFIKLFSCSQQKTPRTLSDIQRNRNNGLTDGFTDFSEKSPLPNRRLLEQEKPQYCGINDLSAIKLLQPKTPDDLNGMVNEKFPGLVTCSNTQRAISITSDPGRSSSTTATTRTSVN